MRDKEIAEKLKKLTLGDPECDHIYADDLLLEALEDAGYTETVKAYKSKYDDFWYA